MSTSIQYCLSISIAEYFKLFLFVLVIKMLNKRRLFNFFKFMSSMFMEEQEPESRPISRSRSNSSSLSIYSMLIPYIPAISKFVLDKLNSNSLSIRSEKCKELGISCKQLKVGDLGLVEDKCSYKQMKAKTIASTSIVDNGNENCVLSMLFDKCTMGNKQEPQSISKEPKCIGFELADTKPADTKSVNKEPADKELVNKEPADTKSVDKEPVNKEPADTKSVDNEK